MDLVLSGFVDRKSNPTSLVDAYGLARNANPFSDPKKP
jgi:hypothetical protein